MSVNGITLKYHNPNPREAIGRAIDRIDFNRRKGAFWAVTLSCFDKFIKECVKNGLDAYKEMKARFSKLLKALYETCKRRKIAFLLVYKAVALDGGHKYPHIHAVLFTECREIKKIIENLWSKNGLGYQSFRTKRKRGNCFFKDIYNLEGWVSYCECFKNKYGTGMRTRISYHGREELEKTSIWRIEQYRRSGNLSIFKKQVEACYI
jgi:hypothetical protein